MSTARSLYELFRRCTVSIFTSAGSQGTGFFVAPGLILTCAHVIQPEKSAPQPTVTILWNQQTYRADIEQIRGYPYPDIALLNVANPNLPDHPYVSLDEEIEIADELYCYGYPDDYPDGDSVTLKYEGPTEKQGQLIKLKEGQVRPGLSGAPLLNTRTRRVCGIMKLTRDRGAALGGRAIPITTVFQEFEQVKIAQSEIYKDNRQWHKALTDTNPTHLAHETISYFSFLSTFLEFEGQWFQDDFKHGRIYVPEKEYFTQLKKILDTQKLALLLGHSAAGKTVLALAFAQYLQDHAGYTVCYKDARQARIGDGRKWHALMREHDYPNLLYILDNCHLSPGEVDDFCYQWRDNQAPTYTQCLLVSRTSSADAYSEARQADTHTKATPLLDKDFYFTFADNEQIILVIRPEKIFRQVIEQYATSLASQDAGYIEALKSDDQAQIARQHSHNLVISRSYLDTWQALGASHHLSEVRQRDTYQMLEEKYLSAHGTTLATLCVLQRYEIRIHNSFIKQFPVDEIKRLEDEKLLIRSKGSTGYGQLYDLVLHSSEARELVQAYIYNQHDNLEYINDFVLSTFEFYLKTKPDNYIAVYESLARHKQNDILKQLLENPELQQCTTSQLKNKETVLDAIRYVYRVAKIDRKRATTLINGIMNIPGIEAICAKLLKATFHEIALYLQYIHFIDARSAQRVVNTISSNTTNIEQLTRQAKEENIQSLFRLERTLQELAAPAESSLAQALLLTIPVETLAAKITLRNLQDTIKQLQAHQYPPDRLKQLTAALDMQQFARQSASTSLQSLFWALHTLKKVAPAQALQLIQYIPLQVLSAQASTSNPGSIDQIIRTLREFGYNPAQIAEFVEALDMQQVAQQVIQHAKQGTLRRLTALLHTLNSISRASAVQLMEVFTTADIIAVLQHTSLKAIGSFLQDQYANRHVREAYMHFQTHMLPQRLSVEPLDEINALLDHLSRIRRVGPQLVHHVLALFVATDITDHLAQADLAQYVKLLRHTRSLDTASISQLLAPLYHSDILRANLASSSLHTMQLLIHNVASLDTNYLSPIQQALPAINIAEKFAAASLRDIGHFLWNVYKFMDRATACKYSIYADQHLPIQRMVEAPPEDVCFLLWNIASISEATSLRLLDEPVIHRLLQNWPEEAGWSAVLAGIAAIAQNPTRDSKYAVALHLSAETLYHWFIASNGGNSYFLALALQGLRAYDEQMARAVVRDIFHAYRIRDRLQSVRPSAMTTRSIALIEGTLQWLEQLSEERQ
jgi:hypothetical protein